MVIDEPHESPTVLLEPITRKYWDDLVQLGGPPLYTYSPQEARRILAEVLVGNANRPKVEIQDAALPVGPLGETRIRLIRPVGKPGPLPAVVYFHGGGWMLGDWNTHDRWMRELAIGADAAVVYVEYERTPEATFPLANEQAYAVTAHLAKHGATYGLDPRRIAVAGDSAGGNMATVVAIMAAERGGPEISAQILIYPATDAVFDTPSYREFGNGPWLTKAGMEWYWAAYLPDSAMGKHPHASPLRASLDQLRSLPPALVITAEVDVLRDEGEAYARRLMEAGVPVTAVRFLGVFHDFVVIDALANIPMVRQAIDLVAGALRRAFHD